MSLWPTSAAYAAALAQGQRHWTVGVDILQGGQVVARLDTVLDGAVKVDSTAVRRSLDLTLVDPTGSLTPTNARDVLSPRQSEVRIWRGLRLANGSIEEVPLGTFGVIDPSVDSVDGATLIKLTGRDRTDAVSKRRFDEPYTVKNGTPTATAITQIVTSRLAVPVRVTPSGNTVPETVFEDLTDPWKAVQDLAASDGMVAYFDQLGTLVVTPDEEVPTGLEYEPGEESVLLEAAREMSAETTYSGVIVTGQHPDYKPIRQVLWDTDPTSPTYYLGEFGKRPYGFNSPLINTDAKASAAAVTVLRRVTKMRQKVTVRTVGHPGHDVGDRFHLEDSRARINGDYVIYGATIPVRPGPISITALEATGV